MSIKPVACADDGFLNWCAYSKTLEPIDLYAIPDTHRIVPVELLQEAVEQLSELNTFAAIRAIIEDKENKQ